MADGEFASTPEVSSVSYLVAGHLQVCSTPARLIPFRGTLGLSSGSKLAGGAVDAPLLVTSELFSSGNWASTVSLLMTQFVHSPLVSQSCKRVVRLDIRASS